MVYGIILIILGAFTAYPVFSRGERPALFLDIKKYGGFAAALVGVWGITDCFLDIHTFREQAVPWLAQLVSALQLITLGILSGIEARLPKIMTPFLVTMGVIAFGLGICQIVAAAVW